MNLIEIESLLKESHRKWYFTHQSAKECVYGSDGVGHDLIHPADQLEASLRNLRVSHHAIIGMQFTKEEKEIDLEEKLENLEEIEKEHGKLSRKYRVAKIQYDKSRFEYNDHCEQMEDRKVSLNAFYQHAQKLLPEVSAKYKDHDDAMEDIWVTRIIYNAAVQGHPLGQLLKIAILPEDIKEKALNIMNFPKEFPMPNADKILASFEEFKNTIGVDEWKKYTQSHLEVATQELTQD